MNPTWDAYRLMQERFLKSACHDAYVMEVHDRAANYLVRNASRLKGRPENLVRQAQRVARHEIRRRSRGRVIIELCDPEQFDGVPDSEDPQRLALLREFLRTLKLVQRDREVLGLLANGYDANAIALHIGLSVKQTRVIVSRARQRARQEWVSRRKKIMPLD